MVQLITEESELLHQRGDELHPVDLSEGPRRTTLAFPPGHPNWSCSTARPSARSPSVLCRPKLPISRAGCTQRRLFPNSIAKDTDKRCLSFRSPSSRSPLVKSVSETVLRLIHFGLSAQVTQHYLSDIHRDSMAAGYQVVEL